MADNVNVTPGSGDIIAADEVGGAKYQRVKIGVGADGTATDLAFGQGLMAASLPVTVASDQASFPVSLAAGAATVGAFHLSQDLKAGAAWVTLTLSSGTGSFPIPSTAVVVGVKPTSSGSVVVGLEAPGLVGTATGAAGTANLAKGIPVDAAEWTWFSLGGTAAGRTLYLAGGASDVITVAAT